MYRDEIDRYLEERRNEMIEDIMELVRIESVKSEACLGMPFGQNNAEVLDKAAEILKRMHFPVKNYDNYVLTADLNDKQTNLDILAHLDVVPAGDGWTVTEPFEPVIKNGKIYGRGTADDKGPAVAAVYAMRAVKELNIPLAYNVRLILGVDEETGSNDIEYYYEREKHAPMTISPDAQFPLVNIEKGILHGEFQGDGINKRNRKIHIIRSGDAINVIPGRAVALADEPDGDALEAICNNVQRGRGIECILKKTDDMKVFIEINSVSTHASTPQKGENALTALLEVLAAPIFCDYEGYEWISALHDFFPHGDFSGSRLGVDMHDELSGGVEISLTKLSYQDGVIKGGFDSRTPLCATNENLRDVIAEKLRDKGLILGNRPIYAPHYISEKSRFVQTLLDCYEMYSGKRERPLTIGGGSYVHAVPNGIAFGCADQQTDNHMHGPNEFESIDQLMMSAKIYAQAIVRLCGGEEDRCTEKK